MNLYKQFCLITLCLFCFNATFAAEQSVSVEWSKSENYIAGQNRNHFYQPETGRVFYSVSIGEFWQVGASFWKGRDETDLDLGSFSLEETHSGRALSINYSLGNLGINFAASASKNEVEVRSSKSQGFYDESSKSKDISISIDYLYTFERIDILPSFGVGQQRNETRYETVGAPFSVWNIQREEQQDNLYAFVGVNVSTYFELGRALLMSPSIQFAWSEGVDGEESQTETRFLKLPKKTLSSGSTQIGAYSNAAGSGYLGVSLAFLVDDFIVRLSHSKTLALDVNSETSALELGVSF